MSRAPEWYAHAIVHEKKTELLSFARLHLAPGPPLGNPYPESLFLQPSTSRIPFLPTPVGDTAAATLTKLAAQWGQRYEQITDSAQVENILAQNTDALFADLNTPAYHDEIVSWFRFTDRSAKRLRDGLDWRCMNTLTDGVLVGGSGAQASRLSFDQSRAETSISPATRLGADDWSTLRQFLPAFERI